MVFVNKYLKFFLFQFHQWESFDFWSAVLISSQDSNQFMWSCSTDFQGPQRPLKVNTGPYAYFIYFGQWEICSPLLVINYFQLLLGILIATDCSDQGSKGSYGLFSSSTRWNLIISSMDLCYDLKIIFVHGFLHVRGHRRLWNLTLTLWEFNLFQPLCFVSVPKLFYGLLGISCY